MSRHWQIAADVFWSVIIVGFVAWIFICCLRRSESPTRDFLKLLFSVGLVAGIFILSVQ